jgi:hypothetical protein
LPMIVMLLSLIGSVRGTRVAWGADAGRRP